MHYAEFVTYCFLWLDALSVYCNNANIFAGKFSICRSNYMKQQELKCVQIYLSLFIEHPRIA